MAAIGSSTDVRPVASWVAEGKEISVFEEQDKLKYSIKNGSNIEKGDISLRLYDTPQHKRVVLKLISLFKRALLGDNPREHCFLPQFFSIYERPAPAKNSVFALFARMRRGDNGGKEVVEAQWGCLEAGEVTWLEAGDQSTHAFLINAPLYRDKMDIYLAHFKEVVTLGPDDRIQSIVIRCVSALNKDLILDEDTCAVTLISAQKRRGLAAFFKVGHGSVAWEGMENGRYFLKWADITSEYPDKQPGDKSARIRITDREIPSESWMIGPACSRSKELTNKMVEYLSREVSVIEDANWSSLVNFGFFAPLRNLFKSESELDRERRTLASSENCLSFAVSALQRAGIFLPDPGRGDMHYIEPNAYIITLHENYSPRLEGDFIVYRKNGAPLEYDTMESRIVMSILGDIGDAVSNLKFEDPSAAQADTSHT